MSTTKTAAIVLAAGMGTRMQSDLPKVMHPLAGRPMVLLLLDSLAAVDPDRVIVVLGPDMDELVAALDTAAPHVETVEQTERLGTGHAVMQAKAALGDFDGDVLILYGDSPLITSGTMSEVLALRRSGEDPAVVVLGFRSEEPNVYGRLILNEDGGLDRIVEAKDTNKEELMSGFCNSGVMAVDGSKLFGLIDRLSDNNAKSEYYLTDVVGLARGDGDTCVVVEGAEDELMGINSQFELAVAERILQDRLRVQAMENGAMLQDPASVYFSWDTAIGQDAQIGPNVFFGTGVSIGDKVVIRAFCHIEGATVANGAIIGPFARLRPGAEIGVEAHIGNFVEIKNATIADGAKANHLSYIGDATVGAKANIGAGTITCNYDGYVKSRTEIGAGAFIGSNTALVAPVKVGDGAVTGAGSTITKDVETDALAVTRAPQKLIDGYGARQRVTKGKSWGKK